MTGATKERTRTGAEYEGEENARAHLEDIVALARIARALAIGHGRPIPASASIARGIEHPRDADSWDDEDVDQWTNEAALSLEVRSVGWRPIEDEATPDEFRVVLTVGGPSLELRASVDDVSDARLRFAWWGESRTLETTKDEDEALQWFAQQFADVVDIH